MRRHRKDHRPARRAAALFGLVMRGLLAGALLIPGAQAAEGAEARAAVRSSGCRAIPPAQPPTTLFVKGRERSLIAAIPEDYDPNTPHDLLIAFHGRTNSNADVRGYYDLERHARRPTIFVYPSGLPEAGPARSWSDPGDSADGLRDYALFDAIVAQFARLYCVDPDRIFAVGHSLGAWFVNSLGCARGNRLRAIATVGGGVSASDCRGTLAAFLAHNPADRLVAFHRGEKARDLFLRMNALRGPPRPAAPDALACLRYGAADIRTPVVWCPHPISITWRGRYYPHQWPRGTGADIMRFLTRQR